MLIFESNKRCADAAAMAVVLRQCLEAGMTAENCKVKTVKACMAKGLPKKQHQQVLHAQKIDKKLSLALIHTSADRAAAQWAGGAA